MINKIPEFCLGIIKKFEKKGYSIQIVGGAVRDLLMGKPIDKIKDWDFATNAPPGETLKIIGGYYDNKYGTVKIPVGKMDPKNPQGKELIEVTTYRSEKGYSDLRHPDKVEWGKTIEEDLKRRDFTINAMALRLTSFAQGKPSYEIIDPFDGQLDLKNKIIRTVGNPNDRFGEDALRLLRAVRLATQLKFEIDKVTFEAVKQNATLTGNVSGERIRDELIKILASDYPFEGLMLLRNSGLLGIILPEIENCFGIEQKSIHRHHIYDVGHHLFYSVKFCPNKNWLVRFATLLHDVGKPQTVGRDKRGTITFYNHEVAGARIARQIAERLRLTKTEREKLVLLVRHHQFTVDEATTPSAARRFIRRIGAQNIKDMIDLRIGDRLGGGLKEASSWRLKRFIQMIEQELNPPFSIHDLAINGNIVMEKLDLKPGPAVGKILKSLFEEVSDDKSKNTKDDLLRRLEEIKPSFTKVSEGKGR